MEKMEFPKGKELREANLLRNSLKEIMAEYRGSYEADIDAALENVNAELERYGLEIVIGHAPDIHVWVKVEPIKEEEANEIPNDDRSERP